MQINYHPPLSDTERVIQKLSVSAEGISDIFGILKGIADQTN